MKKNIIFTNVLGVSSEYQPQPSKSALPEWYKKIPSYTPDGKKPTVDGVTSATVKKCIPVFDAITSGYIITTYTDVYVRLVDGSPFYTWSSFEPITFHSTTQAEIHPAHNGFSYPKWMNSWGIKTPKGYSTLVVQPFHRESNFTILPGIVDTDTYTSPINFPFVLNNPYWEGMIPAGTPVAQVIPFKRDSWKFGLGNTQDLIEQNKSTMNIRSKFFDAYKTMYWNKKEHN